MKTVFTRAERAELDTLIKDLRDKRAPAGIRSINADKVFAFLDRYTEEVIPEHVLACARYYNLECDNGDEEDTERAWDNFSHTFGRDMWQRAIDEVRNENPDA